MTDKRRGTTGGGWESRLYGDEGWASRKTAGILLWRSVLNSRPVAVTNLIERVFYGEEHERYAAAPRDPEVPIECVPDFSWHIVDRWLYENFLCSEAQRFRADDLGDTLEARRAVEEARMAAEEAEQRWFKNRHMQRAIPKNSAIPKTNDHLFYSLRKSTTGEPSAQGTSAPPPTASPRRHFVEDLVPDPDLAPRAYLLGPAMEVIQDLWLKWFCGPRQDVGPREALGWVQAWQEETRERITRLQERGEMASGVVRRAKHEFIADLRGSSHPLLVFEDGWSPAYTGNSSPPRAWTLSSISEPLAGARARIMEDFEYSLEQYLTKVKALCTDHEGKPGELLKCRTAHFSWLTRRLVPRCERKEDIAEEPGDEHKESVLARGQKDHASPKNVDDSTKRLATFLGLKIPRVNAKPRLTH